MNKGVHISREQSYTEAQVQALLKALDDKKADRFSADNNVQTANVAEKLNVSAGAWTTVASITLGAGTWNLVANITVSDARTASDPVAVCTLRLTAENVEVAGQPRTSFPTRGQLFTSGSIVANAITLIQETTLNIQIYPSVTVNIASRSNGPIVAEKLA